MMQRGPRFRVLLLLVWCVFSFERGALAQDAKTLFEKGMRSERCERLQDVCEAAQIDKKKEYRKACDDTTQSVVHSDDINLQKATDALSNSKFETAKMYAKFVCQYNQKQYSEAQEILKQIPQTTQTAAGPPAGNTPSGGLVPRDQSAAMLNRAQGALKAGDLDGAQSAASQVTNPDLKSSAEDILQNVTRYKVAIASGQQKEQGKDYEGAIRSYQEALSITLKGPGDPQGRIQAVTNQKAQAAIVVPEPPKPQAPAPDSNNKPGQGSKTQLGSIAVASKPAAENPAVQVARLLDEGHKALDAQKPADASNAFSAVLRLQAGNAEAIAGKKAAQDLINKDPALQAQTLALAIKSYYSGKWNDAEDALTDYLSSQRTGSRGAASFYLAATRISKAILDNSAASRKANDPTRGAEVQKLFKQARAAQYKPVERYVSPIVMQAWMNSSQGP